MAGQLLTGSFMDYAMPHAADMPSMQVSTIEVPCKNNPMGVKGCGEAGSVASPAAVINALIDALADLGVRALDMPATPHKALAADPGAPAAGRGRVGLRRAGRDGLPARRHDQAGGRDIGGALQARALSRGEHAA